MKKERNNYFSTLLKKGYVLYAVLFTFVALTVLAFGSESSLFDKLATAKNWNVFILVSVGVYLAIGLWYCIDSLLKKQINMSDSLTLAVTASSVLYLAYRLFYLKSYDVSWILVCIFAALIGVALIVIKNALFNSPAICNTNKSNKVSALNYYKALFAKFPVFSIICLSVVELCAMLLFACPTLNVYLSNFKLCESLVTIIICLVLPLAYVVIKAVSSKISALDAILLSLFISLPLMFFYILFTHGISNVMVIWNVLFALVTLLTIIRFICFDFTLSGEVKECSCKNVFFNYAKKTDAKFGLLPALALGSLLALAYSHVFNPGHLHSVIMKIKLSGMIANPAFFPIATMFAIIYGTLLVLGLFAIVGMASKKVHLGDFAVAVLASFAVFASINLFTCFTYFQAFVAAFSLIFVLVIVGSRLAYVKD